MEWPQKHFYPLESKCKRKQEASDLCKGCYNYNQVQYKLPTSIQTPYCKDDKNSICNTSQAYCRIGIYNIQNHEDVGSFEYFNANSNDLITDIWTAKKWNNLQELYEKASWVGATESQKQKEKLDIKRVNKDEFITHTAYNDLINASNFFEQKFNTVNKNDLITKALSDILDEGIKNAKFHSSVCDVCNSGGQAFCAYNCACNYQCCNYQELFGV